MTTALPLITVLLSLSFGFSLALFLEYLDLALLSIADVANRTELRFLTAIPVLLSTGSSISIPSGLSLNRQNLFTASKPDLAKAFNPLLDRPLFSTSSPRILQIASAKPSAGKTTIVCSLACLLADKGGRILLIDADLRRPNVDRFFALENKTGLSSILEGMTTFEEALQRVPDVQNLDILASGPIPPFPTLLLGSGVMRELLRKTVGLYSHILIDSPPLLSAAEATIVASQADAVALVVRYGDSVHAVRQARDLLVHTQTHMLGFIFNANPAAENEARS